MATPVLVTGGAGYIGGHVVLSLVRAGFFPVILDNMTTGVRPEPSDHWAFHQGEVSDRALVLRLLRRYRIDSVIHFAGSLLVSESVSAPIKYFRNNTVASLELIDTCLQGGVENFIFSSTAAVYGSPTHAVVDETYYPMPISPYGRSKVMTERMLEDIVVANPNFKALALRYFNVAGADSDMRRGPTAAVNVHLIGAAIDTGLGRRDRLDIFGADYPTRDGTCERDYIHVADLADIHIECLEKVRAGKLSGALNCGYGRGHTVLEVVSAVERVLGRPLNTRIVERRPGDAASVIADTTRLQATLSWRPAADRLDYIIRTALQWEAHRSSQASGRSPEMAS